MYRTLRILAVLGALVTIGAILAAAGLCCVETADACHADGRHAPGLSTAVRSLVSGPAALSAPPASAAALAVAATATTGLTLLIPRAPEAAALPLRI